MARFANVNNTFTTVGGFHFAIRGVYLAAGWTDVGGSDGTTYSGVTSPIVSGSTGAGGFGNTGAWCRLRDPAGRREVCIQGGNNTLSVATHARIKKSELAGFVGGTPGAVRVPSATDEQILFGAGTDAAPTYGSLWTTSPSGARLHAVAESTPVGDVYGFWFFCTNLAAVTQAAGTFFCEPMAPGSYRPADASPCIWYCASAAYSGTSQGYFAYGLAGQAWSTAITANVGPFTGAMGVNLVDSADDNGYPTYSASVGGSVRSKGVGSMLASKGPARTYPATANTATDARVYLGSYCWPYPNNTVPSVS